MNETDIQLDVEFRYIYGTSIVLSFAKIRGDNKNEGQSCLLFLNRNDNNSKGTEIIETAGRYRKMVDMKRFTKEQVASISRDLYDWTSDRDGDDPLFREAGIALMAYGLSSVMFKPNKAGQISMTEAKKLKRRLIIAINNDKEGADLINENYSKLPKKTKSCVFNYVIACLKSPGSTDWLASITMDYVNNNLVKESEREKHIGEIRLMNCGQAATAVGWYKGKIVLRFEDGTIVDNKRYDDFKKGSIMNPTLLDLTGYKFHNFEVIKPTGTTDKHRNKLWYCKCSCGKVIQLSRAQILGRCGCPKSCGCMK